MYHKRSKHIDIKYHWIREKVGEDGVVYLIHVSKQYMVADVLTKALAAEPFNKQQTLSQEVCCMKTTNNVFVAVIEGGVLAGSKPHYHTDVLSDVYCPRKISPPC